MASATFRVLVRSTAVLGLLTVQPLGAQDLTDRVEFSHRVGIGAAVGNSVIELSDGGFAAVGYVDTGGPNQIDVQVVRLDPSGTVVWEQSYGQTGDDYGWDLTENELGEIVVVGYTTSTEAGDEDVLLLGIGPMGTLRWRRRFGGDRNERAWSLERAPDGGMAIAGETQSVGDPDWDAYMLRLTQGGNQMWAQVLGADGVDRVFDVALAEDGGFVFVGTTTSELDSPRDLYFIRVDALGKPLWQRAFGGDADDVAHGVVSVGDGGFVVTGYGSSFGAGGNDAYLIYLADDGVIEWRNEIGGAGDDRAMMSVPTAEGGFLTIGSTDADGDWNLLLLETDARGDRVAERTLQTPGMDRGVRMLQASDGGYLLTGAFGGDERSSRFGILKVRP
ncbi:MAG: hypothetical protein QF463_02810 [Vicinamibacterales bacterium]|jgi:hypothetical protein|nr:hypothetical protein [Acidobacteriota bacterium]MDP6371135.1 hypothetical protein [Vicinamibacterales bacterium]MDP6607974.1 hypothetical protein [Vicinamibacterales bacterium]HAK57173.1 hypothetical protein [Acidobacteriota bacterium]|tara:strand:- start:1581 stop:2750 length:1170 start_codon:yes stop_codon:yes gene_type:complete